MYISICILVPYTVCSSYILPKYIPQTSTQFSWYVKSKCSINILRSRHADSIRQNIINNDNSLNNCFQQTRWRMAQIWSIYINRWPWEIIATIHGRYAQNTSGHVYITCDVTIHSHVKVTQVTESDWWRKWWTQVGGVFAAIRNVILPC